MYLLFLEYFLYQQFYSIVGHTYGKIRTFSNWSQLLILKKIVSCCFLDSEPAPVVWAEGPLDSLVRPPAMGSILLHHKQDYRKITCNTHASSLFPITCFSMFSDFLTSLFFQMNFRIILATFKQTKTPWNFDWDCVIRDYWGTIVVLQF